jgi:hypothetical protein
VDTAPFCNEDEAQLLAAGPTGFKVRPAERFFRGRTCRQHATHIGFRAPGRQILLPTSCWT